MSLTCFCRVQNRRSLASKVTGLCLLCLVLFLTFTDNERSVKATLILDGKIDISSFEEGKKQFELMRLQSQLPQYGQCWKDAMIFIETGCKQLSDDMQGRLSLAYLNCFLTLQGRQTYDCDQSKSVTECTKDMSDVDRGSFTTFFTHTQNMCYFLQAQIWNEATESTITRLAETSSRVASEIHQASILQRDMMHQQNVTLKNQEILMKSAENLSSVLTMSGQEMERLFSSIRQTTQEQRVLMGDMFDHLVSLKQVVLGEFSGFYTILYYFFSILVSYLLTSTTRTSAARFWLFSLMTLSVSCEYFIQMWAPQFLSWCLVEIPEMDDWIYRLRQRCRQLFLSCGVLLIGFFAYRYEDVNSANNRLLTEIRKQNSDLKHLLFGIQPQIQPRRAENFGPLTAVAQNNAFGDGSDLSDTETSSRSEESDRTYVCRKSESGVSNSDSCTTAQTLQGGAGDVSTEREASLLDELKHLRSATPLREIPGCLEHWVMTGDYSSPPDAVPSGSSDRSLHLSGSPYLLRPRKVRITPISSPALQVESPRSFAKTVKQLERLAQQNSKLVRAVARERGTQWQ